MKCLKNNEDELNKINVSSIVEVYVKEKFVNDETYTYKSY